MAEARAVNMAVYLTNDIDFDRKRNLYIHSRIGGRGREHGSGPGRGCGSENSRSCRGRGSEDGAPLKDDTTAIKHIDLD